MCVDNIFTGFLHLFCSGVCFWFALKGKRHYTFRANGKDVCRKAWLAAHSISRTTWVNHVQFFNYLMCLLSCELPELSQQLSIKRHDFCYRPNCYEHRIDDYTLVWVSVWKWSLSVKGFTVYKRSSSVMVVMCQKEAERGGRWESQILSGQNLGLMVGC